MEDTSININMIKELFHTRGCEIIDMVSSTTTILYRCKCKALLRHKFNEFINYQCPGCCKIN